MSIYLVPACDRPEEIRGLFEAYTAMLMEEEPLPVPPALRGGAAPSGGQVRRAGGAAVHGLL